MPPVQLTLRDRFHLPFGLLNALLGSLWIIVVAPFRGQNTPKSFVRHVKLAVTRKVLSSLSPQQLQSIAGTAESNYIAWAKQHKLPVQIRELTTANSKAFWIGQRDAENVVVFYHGGGFAMPPANGHFDYCLSLLSDAKTAGKSAAVLFLQYDLAPSSRYPRQLTQAVELLRYAIDVVGKSPREIMLHGDSSGANLILGVLSHLLHPHAAIAPLRLKSPLIAAVLSSPVTVLNTENQRFITHEGQDPAAAETIRVWLLNLLGSSSPDAWNEPLRNDASWWSGLASVVDSMLITVASNEMMAEDTIGCYDKIKSVYDASTLFVSNVDFHAEPSIGPALGMEEGEAARMMISYSLERF